MSRLYALNDHSDEIIKDLKANRIPGLSHVHKPVDSEGKASLWPDGVTDGTNYAWFEPHSLLAWGVNDERAILRNLRRAGFGVHRIG